MARYWDGELAVHDLRSGVGMGPFSWYMSLMVFVSHPGITPLQNDPEWFNMCLNVYSQGVKKTSLEGQCKVHRHPSSGAQVLVKSSGASRRELVKLPAASIARRGRQKQIP